MSQSLHSITASPVPFILTTDTIHHWECGKYLAKRKQYTNIPTLGLYFFLPNCKVVWFFCQH